MIGALNSAASAWWAWILPLSVQAAVLAAFVWLLDLALEKRGWPQVRYVLWMLVFVKLLLPPGLALETSLSARVIDLVGGKRFTAGVTETAGPVAGPLPGEGAGRAAVAAAPRPDAARRSPATAPDRLSPRAYAMLIWIAGLVTIFAYVGMRVRRFLSAARAGRGAPLPPGIQEALRRAAARAGAGRLPPVIITDKVRCAATFGVFRPVILFPESCRSALSRDAAEHIFLHELAHISRGDLLANAAQTVISIVFCFHPFVWLAARRLRHVRELCCDVSVAAFLKEQTGRYRQTLLDEARKAVMPDRRFGLGLLGLFENPSTLRARLEHLVGPVWEHRALHRATALLLAAMMLLFIIPMAKPAAASAQAPKAQPATPAPGENNKPVSEPAAGTSDVADVPNQDLRVKGQPQMRYFLIGPVRNAKAPADGYSLLVVMPGGDGGPDFNAFVRRIWKFALPADYIVAEPVAPKYAGSKNLVWPAAKDAAKDAPFSTEQFVEDVIKDVGAKHKLNPGRVFTLSWSSSGPAAYAIGLQEKTAVAGSFVAMSVWHPNTLPPLENGKGRPFYIYHSPDDTTCPIALARRAAKALKGAGVVVKFAEYPGGHGWSSGSPYDDIREGIEWLQNPTVSAEDEKAEADPMAGKTSFADSFETGNLVPDGWAKAGNVPGVNYIWDKETASDGKASLCLEKTVKKYFPIAGWVRSFEYDGKSPSLTASAMVKAANVTKAIIDVQFYDAGDNYLHEWASYIGAKNAGDPPANHDWKEYSGTVKIPNGTKTIVIALQIYGPGKVWFDELKVEYAKAAK